MPDIYIIAYSYPSAQYHEQIFFYFIHSLYHVIEGHALSFLHFVQRYLFTLLHILIELASITTGGFSISLRFPILLLQDTQYLFFIFFTDNCPYHCNFLSLLSILPSHRLLSFFQLDPRVITLHVHTLIHV